MKRGKIVLFCLLFILSSFIVLGVCEDADGDGYGIEADATCTYPTEIDCNDNDPIINPGAVEILNGLDDDCNGEVDDGVTLQCTDLDSDFYNDTLDHSIWCPGENCCAQEGDLDCDDSRALVNPGLEEICGDGLDNDCNADTTDACPEGDSESQSTTLDGGCSLSDIYWADCGGNPITTANHGDSVFLVVATDRCHVDSLVDYVVSEDAFIDPVATLTEEYFLEIPNTPNAYAWAASWDAEWRDANSADPEYVFDAHLTTPDADEFEGKTFDALVVAQCPSGNSDCGTTCSLEEAGFVNLGGRSARSGGSNSGGVNEACLPSWDCSSASFGVCNAQTNMRTRDTSLCIFTGEGEEACREESLLKLDKEKLCQVVETQGASQLDTGRKAVASECGDGFCDGDENTVSCPDDCGEGFDEASAVPWLLIFIVLLLLALVIGGALYYFKLRNQNAVKTNAALGKSPFKTENDEKAVINYAKMSRARKVPDLQIKALLKKSGWTESQVKYAFGVLGKSPTVGTAKPLAKAGAVTKAAAGKDQGNGATKGTQTTKK